jgi:hypothetical protein
MIRFSYSNEDTKDGEEERVRQTRNGQILYAVPRAKALIWVELALPRERATTLALMSSRQLSNA